MRTFRRTRLTFSLEAGAPAGATINGATGAFTWTPAATGSFPITVRVTDNGTPALFDTEAITVTVTRGSNQPPVLGAIGNRTVNELATLAFTATATDPDVRPDALTFSLDAGAPAGATINGTTGAFSWTPTEAQGPGTFPITVRVTDNGTPRSERLRDDHGHGHRGERGAGAGRDRQPDGGGAGDVGLHGDGDGRRRSGQHADVLARCRCPCGATINGSTGAFSWTPTEAQGPGSVPDHGSRDGQRDAGSDRHEAITVTVNEVNVAPVLAAIGNRTVEVSTLLAFTATATDADVPANTLTFSLDAGAPAGATINAATGAFTWTPGGDGQLPDHGPRDGQRHAGADRHRGDHGHGAGGANNAPVLGAIGNRTVAELATLAFTATATDPDAGAHADVLARRGAPAGATINATTGAFSWTPTEAQGPGSFPITVRVTDNGTPA